MLSLTHVIRGMRVRFNINPKQFLLWWDGANINLFSFSPDTYHFPDMEHCINWKDSITLQASAK